MEAGRRRGSTLTAPLIGRTSLLAELDAVFEAARAGTGAAILLAGPGGIGKSSALRVASDRASERGFWVARGRALPDDLPEPFSLVRDLLASLGPEKEESAARDLPPSLVPQRPFVSDTPGAGGSYATPAAQEPGPGRTLEELEEILAPLGRTSVEGLGAVRDRLFLRLTDFFLHLAEDRPLLIAIDDLGFADPSSLHFLERLTPEVVHRKVVILASVAEGIDLPSHSRESVEQLAHTPPFRTIPLRALTVTELAEFATFLLGGTPPAPEDVTRWHAQTDGNPLFVEQVVRSATGAAGISLGGDRERSGGVQDVLLGRLSTLPDVERRILTYAAVLGREFDFPRLAAVAAVSEERVTEALDRLVQSGLLRERGGEVYEFVSNEVRATVYSELTETRRRILHRRVGAALERLGGVSDSELSRQFYLGREDVKGAEYNLRAAQSATRAFAFDTAASHLARAIECERRRPQRDHRTVVRLLTEEGRLLDEAGDLRRAHDVLEEAVVLARNEAGPGLDLGRALLGLAWNRTESSDFAGAQQLAAEAFGLLEGVAPPRDLMAAHRVLGTVSWRLGDLGAAERHQRAALQIAEVEGTPLERGHALVDVANLLQLAGAKDVDAALELYRQAADQFAAADDPNAHARVLMNRAVLEASAGRRDDAFRDIYRALEAAERSRSPIWIGYCLINLAQWRAELGEAAPAQAAIDRAAATLQPLGDGLALQQVLMIRGLIAQVRRAFDEAEARFQESLTAARELQLKAEAAEVLFRLAQLSQRRSELTEARARIAEARAGGLLELRPDLAPQVAELEASLAPT